MGVLRRLRDTYLPPLIVVDPQSHGVLRRYRCIPCDGDRCRGPRNSGVLRGFSRTASCELRCRGPPNSGVLIRGWPPAPLHHVVVDPKFRGPQDGFHRKDVPHVVVDPSGSSRGSSSRASVTHCRGPKFRGPQVRARNPIDHPVVVDPKFRGSSGVAEGEALLAALSWTLNRRS
jgi:hypothetical protein